MKKEELICLLDELKDGKHTSEDIAKKLILEPFVEVGETKIDVHRELRTGVAEVVYGEGKTTQQIKDIIGKKIALGETNILITRADEDKAKSILEQYNGVYYDTARIVVINNTEIEKVGDIAVITGGTSDLSVAEEAAITAELLGNNVKRIYDVGVAGIHRLMSFSEEITNAKCIIAIAGMEGALASVVAGMSSCPVIAVPTSVGYGASYGGLAALLAMINSCANGVSVVNIDNGFGAAFQASLINHIGE